ncbi:MAG: phosphate/phosphite/phosphonate ABC transporter substrate-binding protein [Terriglobales bacterium]
MFRVRYLHLQSRTAAMLVALCCAGTSVYDADRPITVGIVIDEATQEEREPLRTYLTKAMARPVIIAAPDSYGETVAHLADGTYDFACLGALVYMRAHARYGVIPLVQRTIDLNYLSVFVTGTDSPIHSLRDLMGKRFAFGDIASTSGHLMAYQELKQAGINPETDLKFRYSGGHLATAALVETGAVDAGAIDKTVFDFLVSSGKLDSKKVRVFFTSKPYVDYVFVARKNLSEAERENFARALLALRAGKDDPVLKILRAEHFVVANDQEYAPMRQIAHELKMF